MKIFSQYGVPSEGFCHLKEHELIIPNPNQLFTREESLRMVAEADAVIAAKAVDREMIEAAPRLRIICAYGAGYDHIDLKAADERSILVCNVPQTVTDATAELAIGLMLSVGRRITESHRMLHEKSPEDCFGMGRNMGFSLRNAVIGIVGMGRIGSRTADLARAFGAKILYTSRHSKPERDAAGDRFLPLDELLSQSDIVSLHCPSTPETKSLIGRRELSRMKPGAILINTARGDVVQDEALIEALQEHRIAGAGLDVFDGEPKLHPGYLSLNNVVLTPHIGCNTKQTRYEMARSIGESLLCFFRGDQPEHIVNPQVWERCHSAE